MKLLDDFENPMINHVVLIGKNAKNLNRLILKYHDQVNEIHFHGNVEDAFSLRNDSRKIVKVFTDSKENILLHAGKIKEKNFLICPEFPIEKSEDILFITSLGITADLLYRIESIKKEILLEVLEHYPRHSPLNIPLEPFHSILTAKVKNAMLNLWGLYAMFPAIHFHVENDDMIEGPGKLKNELYLSLLNLKGHQFKLGNRPNGLQKYFEAIPKDNPTCMVCEHFHLCFSWALYKRERCELWKPLLDRLQGKISKMSHIINAQSA